MNLDWGQKHFHDVLHQYNISWTKINHIYIKCKNKKTYKLLDVSLITECVNRSIIGVVVVKFVFPLLLEAIWAISFFFYSTHSNSVVK